MFSSLETLPNLNALRSVWQSFGIENFDQFSSLFFQRQAEPGTGYPCAKCGCTHDITIFSPDDIVATCSCESLDCDPIALTPADIEIWELSWTKLARALCRALSLDLKIADLNLYQTWQIGSWSADAVPVILTIQNSEGGLRHIIAQLSARLRRKFILLTPTNSNLDAVCQELLANAEAAVFPLDTTIAITPNGTFQSIRTPGDLFAAFTPQPKDIEQSTAEQAFAIIRQFDSRKSVKPPTLLTVFRLYCMENLSADHIAQNIGCTRQTVWRRLQMIQQQVGRHPDELRRLSVHLDKVKDRASDPRARKIRPQALISEPGDSDD
jgi:hypothetical protein